jgi:hypothetical protein
VKALSKNSTVTEGVLKLATEKLALYQIDGSDLGDREATEIAASSNCDYLTQLIQGVSGSGKSPGVYVSSSMWSSIMGSSCSSGSSEPLWYRESL